MSDATDAAKIALDAHHTAMRLEADNENPTRLWHLLVSLVELCDAAEPRIDLDELLEDARDYVRSNTPPALRRNAS